MPTVSYKNRNIDINNPNHTILTYEQRQAKEIMAFPEESNSWGNGDKSSHTMLITANDYVIGEYDNFLNDAEQRVKNRTTRIQKSAANFSFYTPSPIIFTNSMQYENVSITDRMLKPGLMEMNKGIAQLADVGDNLSKLVGTPINPKVEVIFENIYQRTFSFEFLFAPVSQKETETLKKMIQKLRALSAPKRGLSDNSFGLTKAFVWTAPNTFDIQFLHNGVENENIPKIDECVIEQIDVDYSPAGHWVTFKNGYPAQVRMRVNFRERDPNDRDIIEKGF